MMISNFLNIANIIFEFPGQIMFTSIEKREIQKSSNLSLPAIHANAEPTV